MEQVEMHQSRGILDFTRERTRHLQENNNDAATKYFDDSVVKVLKHFALERGNSFDWVPDNEGKAVAIVGPGVREACPEFLQALVKATERSVDVYNHVESKIKECPVLAHFVGEFYDYISSEPRQFVTQTTLPALVLNIDKIPESAEFLHVDVNDISQMLSNRPLRKANEMMILVAPLGVNPEHNFWAWLNEKAKQDGVSVDELFVDHRAHEAIHKIIDSITNSAAGVDFTFINEGFADYFTGRKDRHDFKLSLAKLGLSKSPMLEMTLQKFLTGTYTTQNMYDGGAVIALSRIGEIYTPSNEENGVIQFIRDMNINLKGKSESEKAEKSTRWVWFHQQVANLVKERWLKSHRHDFEANWDEFISNPL